jgi:phosphoglycerate dehydrogenase-like enzyme
LSHIHVAVSLKTYGDLTEEQAALNGLGTVVGVHIEGRDEQQISQDIGLAEALVVTNDLLTRETIDALPTSIKIIVRGGSGVDAIDLQAARQRGIAVANTPGYATDEVAGHALAMILACARSLGPADKNARTSWDWKSVPTPLRLVDSKLGIVGAGRIGSRVAELARSIFGQVVVYDPHVQCEVARVAQVASLDDLLQQSDIVSLHIALTDATANILDEAALRRLPRGARVVNVSRGGLVDEDALVNLLSEGWLSSAALDVLSSEPPAAGSPLLTREDVLLSPHIGWLSPSCGSRARAMAVDTALEYLNGRPLTSGTLVVDPRARA